MSYFPGGKQYSCNNKGDETLVVNVFFMQVFTAIKIVTSYINENDCQIPVLVHVEKCKIIDWHAGWNFDRTSAESEEEHECSSRLEAHSFHARVVDPAELPLLR